MDSKDNLPILALAAGVALLAAEVRRVGRERDSARREFEGLVTRLAERPTTALLPPVQTPPVDLEPAYISDLPYRDEDWDAFVKVNEQLLSDGEDDE